MAKGDPLLRGKVVRSARKLRPHSPLRNWLARGGENASVDSGAVLLGALTDPASDWVDHAVGYAALREIDLSPTERFHAARLLSHALERPRRTPVLLRRLGTAMLLALALGLVTACALVPIVARDSGKEEHCASCFQFLAVPLCGLMAISVWTLLLFAVLSLRDYRRASIVRREAAATLAQLGISEEHSLPELSLDMWLAGRRERSETTSSGALLRALSDSRPLLWSDRVEAYQALCEIELTPSERTQATHLLSSALALPGADSSRFRRAVAMGFLSALVVANLALLVTHFPTRRDDFLPVLLGGSLIVTPLLTLFTTPLFLAGLSFLERRGAPAVQKAAMLALAHIGGPECIIALYDHTQNDTGLYEEAILTLKAVLPTITADWYGRMPHGSDPVLGQLADYSDEDLALAALDALDAAGSGTAANSVEHIPQDATKSGLVRAKAAAVLPTLIARREREISVVSLLRPSERVSTDNLLRSIEGDASDISNLLRASQANHPKSQDAERQ